ncbi:MAG: ankyrin repeat domain-containing protein [bacterium]|nr:MAG: ankyrin repeat domain-containing protein [bacterium]
MKTAAIVMLVVILLAVSGCGKQENSAKEKEQPQVSQTAPAPPSIGLHAAAAQGNLEAIRQHIKAGSDLNVRDPEGGACPLSTAALYGQTEVAMALIEAGADVNFRGNDGATPLHVAAFFCRTEIVKALLDIGADTNIRNNYGSTPLETVTVPFDKAKGIYDHFGALLAPTGLKLDYERIEKTRPKIAEMLRST